MTITGPPSGLPTLAVGEVLARTDGPPAPGFFERLAGALWMADGSFLVVDEGAEAIYVFDSTGRYLATFGGAGGGPGEFRRIGTVSVTPGDTIAVYDPIQRTLTRLHVSTGLLESSRLPANDTDLIPTDVWPLAADRLVRRAYRGDVASFPAPPTGEVSEVRRRDVRVVLSLMDRDEESRADPIEHAGSFSGMIPLGEVRAPFSNVPLTAVRDGHVWYGSGRDFHLRELDTTFTQTREIRWPDAAEPLDEDEVRELRETLLGSTPSPGHRRIVEAMFSELLRPQVRPPVRRLVLDPHGRVWAGRFEPSPWHRHERLWYVLDFERAEAHTVTLASHRAHGVFLADVGTDRLLLIIRDALGVETVAIVAFRDREDPSRPAR
jgi:hypothetical protein